MGVLLAIVATATPAAIAQTSTSKTEAFTELRNYKHVFFRKELNLTREQENQFFTIYDNMEDELMAIAEETRKLERETVADENASDVKLDATARALFEQKRKEADVELKYFEQFKSVLSKRQLVRLKETERDLNCTLLKYTREHNKGKGTAGSRQRNNR